MRRTKGSKRKPTTEWLARPAHTSECVTTACPSLLIHPDFRCSDGVRPYRLAPLAAMVCEPTPRRDLTGATASLVTPAWVDARCSRAGPLSPLHASPAHAQLPRVRPCRRISSLLVSDHEGILFRHTVLRAIPNNFIEQSSASRLAKHAEIHDEASRSELGRAAPAAGRSPLPRLVIRRLGSQSQLCIARLGGLRSDGAMALPEPSSTSPPSASSASTCARDERSSLRTERRASCSFAIACAAALSSADRVTNLWAR